MKWDPWGALAGAAAKLAGDAWRAMWLSVWNAGIYIFRVVLTLEDHLLTPDISATGPAGGVFGLTFWMAAVLVVILAAVQIGVALFRRDGTSLGRVVIGVGQFVMVWVAWLSYGTAVVAACGGLNDALMRAFFGVTSWENWQFWTPFTGEEVTEAVVATVLGILGLVLWLAAIAHFLVVIARAGALLVLAATAPISAAGLVSDLGKAWFWKSLRWFHAAAFTPVLMTLVTGVGIKITTGVTTGAASSWQTAVGTALPAVLMVLIAAFSPLSLFKLLAFVDPGTTSGAAVRTGLAAVGGLAGLLGGKASATETGGSAAESDPSGRSQGETQGETATSGRFASAQAAMAAVLGPVGQVIAPVMRAAGAVGGAAAAIGTDATNQMGVGHNTYHPDFASGRRHSSGGTSRGSTGDPAARQPDVDDNVAAMPLPDLYGGFSSALPTSPAARGVGSAGPPAVGAGAGAAEVGAVEAAAVVVI